jgi:hypothetical protein
VASFGVICIDAWTFLWLFVSIIWYTISTHCGLSYFPWFILWYNIHLTFLMNLSADHAWLRVIEWAMLCSLNYVCTDGLCNAPSSSVYITSGFLPHPMHTLKNTRCDAVFCFTVDRNNTCELSEDSNTYHTLFMFWFGNYENTQGPTDTHSKDKVQQMN